MSVKALAMSLPKRAFQTVNWRGGTNEPMSGRFAAVRVRFTMRAAMLATSRDSQASIHRSF